MQIIWLTVADCGRRGEPGTFEPEGIYLALVGARFERKQLMEWRHMLVTEDQNTVRPLRRSSRTQPSQTANGYGAGASPDSSARAGLLHVWARFYDVGAAARHFFPSFDEAQAERDALDAVGRRRFAALRSGNLLNLDVFRKRIAIAALTFLSEAEHFARLGLILLPHDINATAGGAGARRTAMWSGWGSACGWSARRSGRRRWRPTRTLACRAH